MRLTTAQFNKKALNFFWFIVLFASISVNFLPQQIFAQEDNIERTITAAREAAKNNRNAETRELFQKVIAQAPSKRKELLRDLADQMTYSGQSSEAVPLYKELLARNEFNSDEERRIKLGLALALSWSDQLEESVSVYNSLIEKNQHDTEALLGKARVLSWMDKLGDSKSEYLRILRQNPANSEAEKNIARIESWRGRQRKSVALLTDYLNRNSEDSEAKLQLAQVQDWRGRADLARRTLQDVLAQDRNNGEAQKRLKEISFRGRSSTRADFQFSTQSDGLEIYRQSIEQNFYFNDLRTAVGPRYERYYFNSENDNDDVTVNRVGFYSRHRINDWSETNGYVFLDSIRAKNAGIKHNFVTFDTWTTFWLSDMFRLDAGANRGTFDNTTSLKQKITVTAVNASLDFTPTEKTRFTARANYGFISDKNRRKFWQIEGERRVWNSPRILLGGRYTGMSFARAEFNNGYFNPKFYQSLVATGHIWGDIKKRFYYGFNGSYGFEFIKPGENKPLYSVGTKINYLINKHWELEARIDRFSSRQASSSGFARTTTGFAVRYVW